MITVRSGKFDINYCTNIHLSADGCVYSNNLLLSGIASLCMSMVLWKPDITGLPRLPVTIELGKVIIS